MKMCITTMSNIGPNQNPFHHDAFRMGTQLGSNITAMFGNHKHEEMESLVLVDTETGDRVHLNFKRDDTWPDVHEVVKNIFLLSSKHIGPGKTDNPDLINLFTWILRLTSIVSLQTYEEEL